MHEPLFPGIARAQNPSGQPLYYLTEDRTMGCMAAGKLTALVPTLALTPEELGGIVAMARGAVPKGYLVETIEQAASPGADRMFGVVGRSA